jgi:AraC family transcriptional regulator of adaptative response / DNA-3-methyladenine glycosylase II
MLAADICERALEARDARFDGLFFVGITSTGVYCRPVCPARVSYSSHRRFFDSAAAAECAGFRPCLRCRPELAPGRAVCDAVSRLAGLAARRIAGGALNGRSVAELAGDLGVSERHLRRALEREIGVPPIELAQTHRLLLAKQLLGDTLLSVTRIAYASGFQSLRRFNSEFRDRYGLNQSAARRARRGRDARVPAIVAAAIPGRDLVRLTLAYRAPLAWDVLLACLQRDAMPEVETIDGGSYMRTVRLDGRNGVIMVRDAGADDRDRRRSARTHLDVALSSNLLPVLMPLLARLRQVFDLDAEPLVIDSHLERTGLGALVRRRPGLRIPGALDGFEVALRSVLGGSARPNRGSRMNLTRVVRDLGEPIETGVATLTRLAPTAARIADAGALYLSRLGVAPRLADAITAIAAAVVDGTLVLEPGSDVVATCAALMDIGGIGKSLATAIAMRTLLWPDSFPVSDRALERAAGASSASDLRARAEKWRPWRAYAALHLRQHAQDIAV